MTTRKSDDTDDEVANIVIGWAYILGGIIISLIGLSFSLLVITIGGLLTSVGGLAMLVYNFWTHQKRYLKEIASDVARLFRKK